MVTWGMDTTPAPNVVVLTAQEVMDFDVEEEEGGGAMSETLKQLSEVSSPRAIKVPRRVNRAKLEEAFLTSFELIGGVSRLTLWADRNPRDFYRLIGRLFPQAITPETGAGKGGIKILHAIPPGPLDGVYENAEAHSETENEDQG